MFMFVDIELIDINVGDVGGWVSWPEMLVVVDDDVAKQIFFLARPGKAMPGLPRGRSQNSPKWAEIGPE